MEAIINNEVWKRILKPKIVEKSKRRIVINHYKCPVLSLEEAFVSFGSSAGIMETTCILLETYNMGVFQRISPRSVVRGSSDMGNMGLAPGGKLCTVEISLMQ